MPLQIYVHATISINTGKREFKMRFSINLSENGGCYLKIQLSLLLLLLYDSSHIYNMISITDVAPLRPLVCRSFDHPFCAFLSPNSLTNLF